MVTSCSSTTPCHGVGDRGVYPTYTAGLLTGVGPYYAQAITYHWSGLPKTVTHTRRLLEVGNGVTETTSIDLATMLARPQSIATGNVTSTAGTAANWSTGSYAYDGTGNIISTYLSSSSLETYRYDGLSRLTSAKRTAAGASTTQTYVYDDYGNLTSYAGASLPTSTSTNRLTAATYDAAGHTTAWGGFTYTWDAQSQLIGESGNLLGRIFAYSADGERLLQRDGSTTTLSLRDLDGKVIRELSLAAGTAGAKWTWKKDTVYRAGLLLASVAPGEGIRHYHLDHLGTPRQVTNRTGQQLVRHDYWPYGREASLSGNQTPDRMRFTGHERDLNLLDRENDDLDYMHARYYNPTNLGRFMSVDPVTQKRRAIQAPQMWNKYSYALASPLKFIDPTGKIIEYSTGFRNFLQTHEEFKKAFEAWKATASGQRQWLLMAKDTDTVYRLSVGRVEAMVAPLVVNEVFGRIKEIPLLHQAKGPGDSFNLGLVTPIVNAERIAEAFRSADPGDRIAEMAKVLFEEVAHALDYGTCTKTYADVYRTDELFHTGRESRAERFELELEMLLQPQE